MFHDPVCTLYTSLVLYIMSSIVPPDLDVYKFTPGQLETFVRIHFGGNRMAGFLPCRIATWLDVFCLEILVVIFAMWAQHARPTENIANRILVVSTAAMLADGQYYLCCIGLIGTAVIHAQTMSIFVTHFNEYRVFFDVTCESPAR